MKWVWPQACWEHFCVSTTGGGGGGGGRGGYQVTSPGLHINYSSAQPLVWGLIQQHRNHIYNMACPLKINDHVAPVAGTHRVCVQVSSQERNGGSSFPVVRAWSYAVAAKIWETKETVGPWILSGPLQVCVPSSSALQYYNNVCKMCNTGRYIHTVCISEREKHRFLMLESCNLFQEGIYFNMYKDSWGARTTGGN